MKKIVFCLVALSLTLPVPSFAEESPLIGNPSTGISTVLIKENGTKQKVTLAMSSPIKNEENRKISLLNTGEQKTVYLSIAGIAIILLAILFLFIKSKKNR